MRTTVFALSAAAMVAVGCCGCQPDFDLSEPLYIIPAEEYYSDCRDEECRKQYDGELAEAANMWFRRFPENTRPVVKVVKESEVPDDAVNPVIKLVIDPSVSKRGHGGEWTGYYREIKFPNARFRRDLFAHELGHAMLRTSRHVTGRLSIMASPPTFYVAPEDIKMLCDAHPEVPCPSVVWCEGTYYDVCRCPSATPEEGEKLMQEQGCLNP
jgi:hypothetical protein